MLYIICYQFVMLARCLSACVVICLFGTDWPSRCISPYALSLMLKYTLFPQAGSRNITAHPAGFNHVQGSPPTSQAAGYGPPTAGSPGFGLATAKHIHLLATVRRSHNPFRITLQGGDRC
ncbi:hypothetical protein GGR57DRAFT_246400 [Xylariaceae sp. FL1272]|nr:hypothetical protein GGR57DRAFT_246400 [Xylariaceae sp. FL1272]